MQIRWSGKQSCSTNDYLQLKHIQAITFKVEEQDYRED